MMILSIGETGIKNLNVQMHTHSTDYCVQIDTKIRLGKTEDRRRYSTACMQTMEYLQT